MDRIDGIPLERYELTDDDVDRALELGQELGICAFEAIAIIAREKMKNKEVD